MDSLIVDIPRYIFGANSYRIVDSPVVVATLDEGQSAIWFKMLVMAVFVCYLVWLSYWSNRGVNHSSLFGYMGYHRGDYSSKLGLITPSFGSYMTTGVILSFGLIYLPIVRLMGIDVTTSHILHYVATWQIYLVLFGIIAGIYIYQILLLYIIGAVTLSQPFTLLVIQLKSLCRTVFTITVAPVIFFYVLSNFNHTRLFIYIIIAQVVAVMLLYLYEIFLLFATKKVSLLHTILYLCIVELLPITLIWGLFGRL